MATPTASLLSRPESAGNAGKRCCAQVEAAEAREADDTIFDPYAAESTGEFFAVMSEVFFEEPVLLRAEYADLYALLCRFYRQDPAARDAEQPAGHL